MKREKKYAKKLVRSLKKELGEDLKGIRVNKANSINASYIHKVGVTTPGRITTQLQISNYLYNVTLYGDIGVISTAMLYKKSLEIEAKNKRIW